MAKRARRNHAPAFKAKVALVALKGEKTLADLFGSGSVNRAIVPPVDLRDLHAKIGELALENDFLAGALGKAGLLSAKRPADDPLIGTETLFR